MALSVAEARSGYIGDRNLRNCLNLFFSFSKFTYASCREPLRFNKPFVEETTPMPVGTLLMQDTVIEIFSEGWGVYWLTKAAFNHDRPGSICASKQAEAPVAARLAAKGKSDQFSAGLMGSRL